MIWTFGMPKVGALEAASSIGFFWLASSITSTSGTVAPKYIIKHSTLLTLHIFIANAEIDAKV